MEEEKQVQKDKTLTKKEKAEAAGRDVAEVAARGAGRYFGGSVGGAAVDVALQTKAGQKVIGGASKVINKNPITRNVLAKNQGRIGQVKSIANSLVSGISNSEIDSLSESYDDVDNNVSEVKGTGVVSGLWKKLPLKAKLIIIGVIAAFCFLIFFLVIFITPLMELEIIDIEGMGGPVTNPSYGYSSIPDNTDYWWPIGSSNVNSNGLASGMPTWSTITSSFGPRIHPITGEVNSFHTGVDIADGKVAGTTNVIASRSGRVVYPLRTNRIDCPTSNALDNCGGGYGNYVIIEHDDGSSTLYAHLHQMTVTVVAGDYVLQGKVIGKIGSSGNSTGPHLHFEVRYNGSAVEPLNYVNMNNPRP